MAEYLLTVHGAEDEELPEDFDFQSVFDAVEVFNEELRASGVWVFAGGLQPASTATVVDCTGAAVLTTDGPYLETKEHIGGLWILECANMDEALAWARKGVGATRSQVEVREIFFNPGPE